MTGCPACGRPVAMARQRCLYCGAELPPDLVAAAVPQEPRRGPDERPTEEPSPQPAPSRELLVIDFGRASPADLERALSLSPYEAALRARRGGLHLHGLFEGKTSARERERLLREGLSVEEIPEAEVRIHPLHALGGDRDGERLRLRTEDGDLTLVGEDLLIVVRGPIARQYQPSEKRRRLGSAALEDGHRLHLHRRPEPRPVEIDPSNFEFGFAVTGSPRLEIESWLRSLGEGVALDDNFRWLPPALGYADPAPRSALSAVGRLAASGRGGTTGKGDPTLLDNAAQFRFYSAWRAAIERRRQVDRRPA